VNPRVRAIGLGLGVIAVSQLMGVLAKWIMPGDDPGGIFVTIGIGIAGSFVGGFLASLVGLGTAGGFSLGSIAVATVGALVLLFAYRKFKAA